MYKIIFLNLRNKKILNDKLIIYNQESILYSDKKLIGLLTFIYIKIKSSFKYYLF